MTDTLTFDNLTPPDHKLYGFQTVGVAYALASRRTIIGDEMGLGKTATALVAAEAAKAFPLIVICPASLKGNWAREAATWLPHRSVEVVTGRNGGPPSADIIVVNYDLLDARLYQLEHLGARCLVADESHYLKSPSARRTRAAKRLAEKIPDDGLVLCLTGTPILNRPTELVPQLELLGRLADVAPTPRGNKKDARAWEFAFKFRYAGAEHNGYGWDFKGASNLAELNERLRRCCLIRRERTDVLTDMKATGWVDVPLSLNGALNEYRKAEADLIRWLYDKEGAEAARAAMRAEALALLNRLRVLVGEAKISSAIEWADNFLESNPGRSLIIFAHHKAVQKALAEHYGCPTILGGQSTDSVEEGKRKFQAGEARVIVCSLSAAREGHTLTKASDVLFVEMGWTPGGMDQASDRANRIGQTRDVFAWRMLAEDTVDERVAALIDSKRQVFNAAIRGEAPSTQTPTPDESVTNELLNSYRKDAA